MKFMKKYGKLIAVSAAALGMTAAPAIEGSLAYFTTYVSAGGVQEISLGSSTKIEEKVERMTKEIIIKNPSENDCFVRVKVFTGAQVPVSVSGDDNWSRGEDDYWYYGQPLEKEESTTVLHAKIDVPEGFDRDNFNVVVIQECTPVIYDDGGNPSADWNTFFGGEETWKEAGE